MQLKLLLSPVFFLLVALRNQRTPASIDINPRPRFQREGPIGLGCVASLETSGGQQLKPPVHPHVRHKLSHIFPVVVGEIQSWLLHVAAFPMLNLLKPQSCGVSQAMRPCPFFLREAFATQSLSLGIASCRTCRTCRILLPSFVASQSWLPLVAKYAIDFLQTNRG